MKCSWASDFVLMYLCNHLEVVVSLERVGGAEPAPLDGALDLGGVPGGVVRVVHRSLHSDIRSRHLIESDHLTI